MKNEERKRLRNRLGFIKYCFVTGQKGAGFTLIELLVVVSVLSFVVVGSSNLFLSSLVGAGKGNSVIEVKENGEYAVVQIEKSLRNAVGLVENGSGETCANDMGSLRWQTFDGTTREIGASDDRLVFNGSEFLTAKNVSLVGGGLDIDCRVEPGSNATFVEITFGLERGGGSGDKPEETYAQQFNISVALRNRE